MQPDNLIGKTLGQYEILQEVGRGGMATVYRARQQSINRTVAVKVLPPHLLHDPSFYERFEREVDVIAHLEHPHILPIYDFGKDEGVPYIVMRYLGGGSMRDYMRRGLPALADLDRPLAQVASALDYAHKQGIIHRDLKPGNIMLDENGNAYLTDFGIARVLGSDLTGSAIIGTPAYMSPEQANGFPLDARADIYSLGVVLFELITGREPYQAETPMALLLKHINEPMPPVSDYRADVLPAVDIVVMRSTAKDPDDRYTSAGEMAQAFSDALRSTSTDHEATTDLLPVTAEPLPPRTEAAQTRSNSPDETAAPATVPPPVQPARRAWLLPVMLVVVALLVVAGVVLLLPEIVGTGEEEVAAAAQATRDTHATQMAQPPTPFVDARSFSNELYALNIPADWQPGVPPNIIQLVQPETLMDFWYAPDRSGFIMVEIQETDLSTPVRFGLVVQREAQRLTGPRSPVRLIDEDTAPDGTVRQSFRLEPAREIEPGQMDVFYFNRDPYLVILRLYSTDPTGNALVDTFQMVLDSLRIRDA